MLISLYCDLLFTLSFNSQPPPASLNLLSSFLQPPERSLLPLSLFKTLFLHSVTEWSSKSTLWSHKLLRDSPETEGTRSSSITFHLLLFSTPLPRFIHVHCGFSSFMFCLFSKGVFLVLIYSIAAPLKRNPNVTTHCWSLLTSGISKCT